MCKRDLVCSYQILGVRLREANKLQNTGQWFNDRTGKLTASRMRSAKAFLKTKKDKEPEEASERRKLKIEILCERLTGDIVPKYVTNEMQWGIDQEPVAKEFVSTVYDWTIKDLGFVEHPRIEFCGASPDGYIEEENALIEIKCPTTSTMLTWLIDSIDPNWLPTDHLDQMTLQSACMGGIPVYFVAYDPRLPDKQKLLVRKFEPTAEQIADVEQHAVRFLAEVDEIFEKLTKGN